jgi:hypothetical protein
MLEVVKQMTTATAAQAKAFSDYLEMFKVTAAPVARTMRDEDEYLLELARKGYPLHGTPDDQARWVLEQSN